VLAVGSHLDSGPSTDRESGESHLLGEMPLEHEAEFALAAQRCEFAVECVAECFVFDACKKVVKSRHGPPQF
jgi:hypothetical protein